MWVHVWHNSALGPQKWPTSNLLGKLQSAKLPNLHQTHIEMKKKFEKKIILRKKFKFWNFFFFEILYHFFFHFLIFFHIFTVVTLRTAVRSLVDSLIMRAAPKRPGACVRDSVQPWTLLSGHVRKNIRKCGLKTSNFFILTSKSASLICWERVDPKKVKSVKRKHKHSHFISTSNWFFHSHTIPKFHFCPKIIFDFYQSNFDGKIQIENFMNLPKLIFGQKLDFWDSVQGKSRAI